MTNTLETIIINPSIRVRIVQDEEPTSPADFDTVGQIAYAKSSHYCLGTEQVDGDRMAEIRDGIASGELIGLPVFAFVHSGATIRAADSNPFDCPWDSGQSGFVYCTPEKAIKECGDIATALKTLTGECETFAQYLEGDVYGVIVERIECDDDGDETAEDLDSCWGFYGLDYAREEGTEMGKTAARELTKQRRHDKAVALRQRRQRERDLDAHMAGL